MLIGEEKSYQKKLLFQDFLKRAKEQPQKTAIYDGDKKYSYEELKARAVGICSQLRNRGVREGERVIVNLPRGYEQIAAILGILMAGAVYIPVGIHQPKERKLTIAKDANAVLIIDEAFPLAEGKESDICPAQPEQEAYIIFTSGSTGKPKGVRISHKAAMNTIDSVNEYFRVSEKDTALQVSAIDFDLSVYDIFGLLSVGGSLVALGEEQAREPEIWQEKIRRHQVSLWNTVPALFEMLVNASENQSIFESVEKVFLSGDWVSLDIYERMQEVTPNACLVAMGGATEGSIWSNYHMVKEIKQEWNSIPYGVPLANQKFVIMTEQGEEVAEGEIGELWIGGEGVALGYTDNKLTENSFVSYQQERWYKTGDYGRLSVDGEMIFCGRRDNQLKLHGFRIELSEIEKTLMEYPEVAKAAVTVMEENQTKRLVAGVVPVIRDKKVSVDSRTEYPLGDTYKEEANQIRGLLQEILQGIEIAPEYGELEKFYKDFLREGKERSAEATKTTDEQMAVKNTVQEEKSRVDINILAKNKELIQGVLKGEQIPAVLLEQEELSPECMAYQEKENQVMLSALTENLQRDCRGKQSKVMLMGAQNGLFASYLLERIPGIHLTVVTNSHSFSMQIRERLEDHKNVVVMVAERVTDYGALYNSMDAVISINQLHTARDEGAAVLPIPFVLKQSGIFYGIEQNTLRPSAYLTSMILKKGFGELNPRRRVTHNPMLPAEEWLRWMQAYGMTGEKIREQGNFYLIRGENCNQAIQTEQVREFLTRRLPYYMVPEQLIVVPDWDYSVNGKVKKDFLSTSMHGTEETGEQEAFRGREKEVAELLKKVLKIPQVSSKKSFFEMGGDSLLLTRFLAAIKERYNVSLSMKDAYEEPYIHGFAKRLEELLSVQEESSVIEEGEI